EAQLQECGPEGVGRQARAAIWTGLVAGGAGGAQAERGEDRRALAEIAPQRHGEIRLAAGERPAPAHRGEDAQGSLDIGPAARRVLDSADGDGIRSARGRSALRGRGGRGKGDGEERFHWPLL